MNKQVDSLNLCHGTSINFKIITPLLLQEKQFCDNEILIGRSVSVSFLFMFL